MEDNKMMADVATNNTTTDEKPQTAPGDIKTIDVQQLPDAGAVQNGDTLLLVRPNSDGTQQAMKVKGTAIAAPKKKKKQQYVIGRAIRPRACEIGGMENWYVFGSANWHQNLLLLNIVSMSVNSYIDIGYDMVVLNITHWANGNVYVFKKATVAPDKDNGYMTFWANGSTASTDNWDNYFKHDWGLANAFRVDSYDLTARVLTLNLTHKCVQTRDLRSASAHHYFKDGVRRWHVSKTVIAREAFSPYIRNWDGRYILNCGQYKRVILDEYLLVKKEVVQSPRMVKFPDNIYGRRGKSRVVSYSKVSFRELLDTCTVNNGSRKRRAFGKYKIWARDGWCISRKSDEYLHCRIKCVGLGQPKNVPKGPSFDQYRVTVREI